MYKKENISKSKEQRESGFLKMKYIFLLSSFLFSLAANAQCAMCRAALTGDANTSQAEAVNDGIVYLMVIPYLLVAIIGFLIYRMKKNKSKIQ